MKPNNHAEISASILEGVRSARLVVIASEGRCTESIYFAAVKDKLRAPNVHVEILSHDSNESSLENANRARILVKFSKDSKKQLPSFISLSKSIRQTFCLVD